MSEWRILVGWWNPNTGQLVDIPGYDNVAEPDGWLPAFVITEDVDA